MTEQEKITAIIETFILPTENPFVCDELSGYESGENLECWCSKNCDCSCPELKCYLKWLEMKEQENRQ